MVEQQLSWETTVIEMTNESFNFKRPLNDEATATKLTVLQN